MARVVQTDRLVGREPVIAAARAALSDAAAGRGQLVMITGEAGIGKTAVLAAVIDEAGPQTCVLRGFCVDGSGVPPYWPWSQVLRATRGPATALGEAAWLLGIGTPEAATAAAAADAQFRLFDAVARRLTTMADDSLVLVVLDDLQWADEPSVSLLGFLVRSLAASRVLLLGAFRETEASPDLIQLAASAQQLVLGGLGSADVEAMVGSMLAQLPGPRPPPAVISKMWQRSGGNPFFVRELTRLLITQGAWHKQTQIPASVSETLRRRLARLSTPCVRLLEWAAVAGRDIDPGLLAHSGVGSNEAVCVGLLDEARRAGVVTGKPDLRFTHDLYRETIIDGLSPAASMTINLAVGRALQRQLAGAARVATHLLAAGAPAQHDAFEYSLLAASEATARLGHADACDHYLRALELIEKGDDRTRADVLIRLGASHARAGATEDALRCFRDAAVIGRDTDDAVTLASAAFGVQSLGNRSGAANAELLDLLRDASDMLDAADGPLNLRSRVLAATARTVRHGSQPVPSAELVALAHRAVEMAAEADDASALATAKLAVHDVIWAPGTARERLPVIAEMLDAAQACGDNDLAAEAHLLRAAALIEIGDPAGRDELLGYITLAGDLGHARGRWSALTRRATFAQLAGRAEESARLGEEALELGLAIGEQDAIGCFCTSRWALVALGVREPATGMDAGDPLWPMFPLLAAWPHSARGDAAAARDALGDFSVLDITVWTGLEGLAVAAVVFALVGSDAQRRWTYDQLHPHAGTHVVVGGCASYHAAVDHHLGALAASLGDTTTAAVHFRDAVLMHERLGAAGWSRISEQALAHLPTSTTGPTTNEFRLVNGIRLLTYAGTHVQLADSKGLRDLAVLIDARGEGVHVLTLIGHPSARIGADPVLDQRAKTEFKARLNELDQEIDDAVTAGFTGRAEARRIERDALIHELAAAAGLAGRDRRLGDETERARKTVSARVRDAIAKIDRVHPQLAEHLRESMRMGTVCSYNPFQPTAWLVRSDPIAERDWAT
jgi:AAA ATPase domain